MRNTTRRFPGAMAAIAASIVFGFGGMPQGRGQSPVAASTPPPAFEVVSIKPNHDSDRNVFIRMDPGGRFEAHNITVKFLLEEAYGIRDPQLSESPGWLDSEHYNIEAKPDDSVDASKLGRDERQAVLRAMLQGMLADRFKLVVHHETREQSEYALVVTKNGPKFHETTAPEIDPKTGPPGPPAPPTPGAPVPRGGIRMMGRGDLTCSGIGLKQFADVLARQIGHVVVDQTGLKGLYDFTLKWTPDEGQGQMFRGAGGPPGDAPPPSDASGPTIFTALQEQLGLKLESQKGPVDTIVIDHVERPSEN
ncbi:MAG TPA: TIGR03435 family protein [Bryobacteraceae bacterium]|nr:TIGR03435 family protein [Bryobacteraceae bacterium]